MLHVDEALDPTVSTLSKPAWQSLGICAEGCTFSSLTTSAPTVKKGRLANGLRIGMVGWWDEEAGR